MRNRVHHFSIGVINVSLRSECRSFINEYQSLYSAYHRESAGKNSISVDIRSTSNRPWTRGPYTLRSHGVEDFRVERRFEVLPHLEWYINWQIIKNHPQYLQLHASSLSFDGQVMILPGSPGRGKTTLTAGLLTRGWSYLCDEFALIDSDTLMVRPYPRALCIKEPSFSVIDQLGLPLCRKTPYQKATKGRVAFLQPLDYRQDAIGQSGPVRWIIFPQYIPDTQPAIQPMTRSQALFELAQQCFNIKVYQEQTLTILTAIVRHAFCYRLISGEINATCDVVQQMIRNQQNIHARSA